MTIQRQTMGGFLTMLCMVLFLISPARAKEYELYIAGTQVTDENCGDLSNIPGVVIDGLEGWLKYDPNKRTLTMKNISIRTNDNVAIEHRIVGLKIDVVGANWLIAKTKSALYCHASTELEGDGQVFAMSENNVAVYLRKTGLTISDINVTVNGKWGIAGESGAQSETLTLKNTSVSVKGSEGGIGRLGNLTRIRCVMYPQEAEFDTKAKAVVDKKSKEVIKQVYTETYKQKYPFYIAGTQVTDLNHKKLSKIKGVSVAEGGEFWYDIYRDVLIMKGVTISAEEKAINNEGWERLKIEVSGSNSLKVAKNTAFHCGASMVLEGDGALTIESNAGTAVSISTGVSLSVSDISLKATGKKGICGIDGTENESLILKNATVTATGTTKGGIFDLAVLKNEGGKIVVPDGGKFDETQHAVVDQEGKVAKEVKIEPSVKYPLYIAGTQVTELNCNDLSSIGKGVRVDSDGEFKYDPNEKILTMKSVSITVDKKIDAIYNEGVDGLKIEVLASTNYLETISGAALKCAASTELKGIGTLITESPLASSVTLVNGVGLTISDIELRAKGRNAIAGDEGTPTETLILKNAKVLATGYLAAITHLASFTSEGVEIVVPDEGKFDVGKHAIVDKEGKVAKEVRIGLPITKYPLYIAGTQVTDENCNDLSKITGVWKDASTSYLRYNPVMKTLTMSYIHITGKGDKNAIYNEGIDGLKIVLLSSRNRLKATNAPALLCTASTELEGDGSLTIESENDIAVLSKNVGLSISDIELSAKGTLGIAGENSTPNETLVLKNAKITATGSIGGIAKWASWTTEYSEIVAPDGGKFDETQHAVVDKDGGVAKEVKLASTAAKYPIRIADRIVTERNCNDFTGIEGITVAAGGEFKYDPKAKILTMKDVTMSVYGESLINHSIAGLKIVVSGTNRLMATYRPALLCSASTEFEGQGSLTIASSSSAILISNQVTLTISDITLEVNANSGICGTDGTSDEKLTLKNAKVTITGGEEGIVDLASFSTEGVEILVPDGGRFDEMKHAVVDAEGNIAKEVTIGKKEAPAIFAITPSSLEAVGAAGGTPTVALSSNKAWKLTLNPSTTDWVTPSATSGTGDANIIFTVVKNETSAVRTVTVTFTQEETNKRLSVSITQVALGNTTIPLTELSFTQSAIPLKVESTVSLLEFLKFQPSNATNKRVMWSVTSGADKLEKVDDNGNFKGKAVGEAKVTVTSEEGSHTAEITINVQNEDVAVKSVIVTPAFFTCAIGGKQQLSVSVTPATATNKTATWAVTAGADVVSVDGAGLVTALKEGSATVTATVGGKTAQCMVTVSAASEPLAVEDAVLATLAVAPNPFTTQLRIVNPTGVAATYELVTLSGVVVRSGALNDTEVFVDTEALPAGLYFVRLMGQNGAKRVEKVFKY